MTTGHGWSGVLISDELPFFNPDVPMCCQANVPFR